MAKKTSRYKAKCIRACFWLKQYWPIGKVYEGIRKPPEHFELLAEVETQEESGNDESGGDE